MIDDASSKKKLLSFSNDDELSVEMTRARRARARIVWISWQSLASEMLVSTSSPPY